MGCLNRNFTMAIDSLEGLTSGQKQELVASLASLIVGSNETELSSESLIAVAKASGNELSPAWAAMFANLLQKSGGIDKFCPAPGSGGGGGGGAGGGDEAAAVVEEEEVKEEEEEIDFGGGMDMFGGEEGGGDY